MTAETEGVFFQPRSIGPTPAAGDAEFSNALAKDLARKSALVVIEPRLGGALKRCFDIALSALALVVLSVLFLLIAVLLKAQDGGPVFFGQKRLGYGGKAFRCWKFRSMAPDAEARLGALLRDNPEAATEFRATQKLRKDPRVTPLGAILRKTSLDELPQFFNVLIGEMSLVGPRPVIYNEFRRFGPCMRHYLKCRPGITGLWQISGRSDTTYEARVEFDREYARKWSLWLDLSILIRTPFALLFARGAY